LQKKVKMSGKQERVGLNAQFTAIIPMAVIHPINSMKLPLKNLFVLGLVAVSVSTTSAATKVYTASLSGAAESPPVVSDGTGSATLTIDDSAFTMRLDVDFSGLTGNVTVAHIHGPTTVAGSGTAGVATTTPSFAGFPSGVTSGSYDQTFDMTSAASYRAGFITANGSTTAGAFNALVLALDEGKAYLNIHSTFATGGEIRGFFTAIPEPSSFAALAGLVGLGGALVTRRRRA
jgi:hypothetical protein